MKLNKIFIRKKLNLKNMCFPFGNRRMRGREEVELKSLSLHDSFLWNSLAARQRKRRMPAAMPRAKSLWEWVIALREANQVSTSLILTHMPIKGHCRETTRLEVEEKGWFFLFLFYTTGKLLWRQLVPAVFLMSGSGLGSREWPLAFVTVAVVSMFCSSPLFLRDLYLSLLGPFV